MVIVGVHGGDGPIYTCDSGGTTVCMCAWWSIMCKGAICCIIMKGCMSSKCCIAMMDCKGYTLAAKKKMEKRKEKRSKLCPLKDSIPRPYTYKMNCAKPCAAAHVLIVIGAIIIIGGNRVLQSDFPSYLSHS